MLGLACALSKGMVGLAIAKVATFQAPSMHGACALRGRALLPQ
jgi:hypothetical protein